MAGVLLLKAALPCWLQQHMAYAAPSRPVTWHHFDNFCAAGVL
jgi:hypothetical protein